MTSLEKYRLAAKGKIAEVVDDYIAGGAGNQPQQNVDGFKNYLIRPYLATDTSTLDTKSTIQGHPVSVPVCIAPMGNQHMLNPLCEHVTAAAAKKQGVGFAMSGFASITMEELVTKTETGLKFLNIYIYKERHWTENLVKRAESCGFHGFILGIAKMNPTSRYKKTKLPGSRFENVKQFTSVTDPSKPGYPITDPAVTWSDVAWLKSITKLPVIVKGVLSARDALRAVTAGVDGILVSNHGGRQLADVPAPIDVLPEVIAAVGNACEVFLDGGVRCGADIFKALGLGAKAVFLGRPILWGMACEGKDGVVDVLRILESELRATMMLAGVKDLKRMPRDIVIRKERIAKM